MNSRVLRAAPFVSLRHARAGRLGDEGRLPPGWDGDQISRVDILDVGFADAKPSVTLRLDLHDGSPRWSDLSLSAYLAAPKGAVVALAAQVTFSEWTDIEAAMLVLREWRSGGELVRQSAHPLHIAQEPQVAAVALEMGDQGRVAQPVLMIGRQGSAAGSATMTFTGIAFGALHEHPRWLWT